MLSLNGARWKNERQRGSKDVRTADKAKSTAINIGTYWEKWCISGSAQAVWDQTAWEEKDSSSRWDNWVIRDWMTEWCADLWLNAHGEHHETTSWLLCCQKQLRLSHLKSTHANQRLTLHTHIPKQCLGSVSLQAFTACCTQAHTLTHTHTLSLHLPPPQKSVGSLDCKRTRKTNYFKSTYNKHVCCIIIAITTMFLKLHKLIGFFFSHYFDNFIKYNHNLQLPRKSCCFLNGCIYLIKMQ